MTTSLRSAGRLAEINLLDLDRWARHGAPFHWFALLRDVAPVWRHPSPDGGSGFWVVSSYEQVVALGKCPHALSSDVARGGVAGLGPGDELQTMQDQLGAATGFRDSPETAMLLSMDPPEHTGYRKIVNKGFTPRMISLLEDKVRGLANRYLDGRPAGEPFDLVTELSMPLPITVIAEMLGIPSARHADLARWSNEAVAGTDPEYRNDKAFSELQALVELLQAFDTLKQDRVDSPGDDIASVLLGAVVDGETLTPARFKMFLLLLLIAGNETTRNGISHAVLNLATFPEQWERLRQDPALVPSAVEEVLRVASPVLYFRRNVVADADVAGQTLAAGDLVSLWSRRSSCWDLRIGSAPTSCTESSTSRSPSAKPRHATDLRISRIAPEVWARLAARRGLEGVRPHADGRTFDTDTAGFASEEVNAVRGTDTQLRPTTEAHDEGRRRPQVGDVDDAGSVPAVAVGGQGHPLWAHAPKDGCPVLHVNDVGVDDGVAGAYATGCHSAG